MYNKSEIMMTAWDIRRNANVSMSTALKAAWARIKAIKAAEAVANGIDWNTKVKISNWEKANHNRTYIDVAVYTNAWNRKRTVKIGYVDNMTGCFIPAEQ